MVYVDVITIKFQGFPIAAAIFKKGGNLAPR